MDDELLRNVTCLLNLNDLGEVPFSCVMDHQDDSQKNVNVTIVQVQRSSRQRRTHL